MRKTHARCVRSPLRLIQRYCLIPSLLLPLYPLYYCSHILAKWDQVRRSAEVESRNWVPQQVLFLAAEYQKKHLPECALHHIEALVYMYGSKEAVVNKRL